MSRFVGEIPNSSTVFLRANADGGEKSKQRLTALGLNLTEPSHRIIWFSILIAPKCRRSVIFSFLIMIFACIFVVGFSIFGGSTCSYFIFSKFYFIVFIFSCIFVAEHLLILCENPLPILLSARSLNNDRTSRSSHRMVASVTHVAYLRRRR